MIIKVPGVFLITMDNKTVIDTIVKYSKDCIQMRFTKNHLTKSYLLIQNFPSCFIIPSLDTIKIILNEIDMRIKEKEDDIGKRLTKLFEGNDFGYRNDTKYSLSTEQIRAGYLPLMDKHGIEHIILLRPYRCKQSGLEYIPGVLYKSVPDISESNLISLYKKDESTIDKRLVDIIINRRTAYEYLESIGDKQVRS